MFSNALIASVVVIMWRISFNSWEIAYGEEFHHLEAHKEPETWFHYDETETRAFDEAKAVAIHAHEE